MRLPRPLFPARTPRAATSCAPTRRALRPRRRRACSSTRGRASTTSKCARRGQCHDLLRRSAHAFASPVRRRFWHQAHWALWGNADLLHRSDGYYIDALPNATATAAYQGYDGARWPKMVLPAGNRGRGGLDAPWLGLAYDAHPFPPPWSATTAAPLYQWESNSGVGPLLVWQQPHVIWLADLQRRAANVTGGPAAAGAAGGGGAGLRAAEPEVLPARRSISQTRSSLFTHRSCCAPPRSSRRSPTSTPLTLTAAARATFGWARRCMAAKRWATRPASTTPRLSS